MQTEPLDKTQIDARQLDGRLRQIGTLNGRPVLEARTKGGLNMVIDAAGKLMGAAPHRAIARRIAKKNFSDVKFTDLAKGDWVDSDAVDFLMPKYEALTARMRTLQG